MTQERRRLGLTVPETLYGRIIDKATYQGKTINSTCLDIFWEYFDTRECPNSSNSMELGKGK